MKTKSLFFLSTLTVALGGASLSPTAWAEENTRTSWTLDEMIAVSSTIEAEFDEACSTDDDYMMCVEMYVEEKSDPFYQAYLGFHEYQGIITSVNPTTGVIKFYYNYVDLIDKYINSSTIFQGNLTGLYAVQIEQGHPIGNFAKDIENGTTPSYIHVLINESVNNYYPGQFPADTEISFSDTGVSDASDLIQRIHYLYATDFGRRAYSSASLESCFKDPNYGPGMECQIRFTNDGRSYIAVNPEVATTDTPGDDAPIIPVADEPQPSTDNSQPSTNPDDSPANPTTDEPQNSSPQNSASLATSDNNSITSNTTPESTVQAENTSALSTAAPTTPDTGAGNEQGSTEFPWWLGAIFAVGFTTLVWLFWPKSKNLPKKS